MPRGDGTGPMGMDRMARRGAGHGAGYAARGYAYPAGFARGLGCGFGRGRGFRRMYYASRMPCCIRFGYPAYTESNGEDVNERGLFSNQAEILERQLQQVRKRLSRLKEDEK